MPERSAFENLLSLSSDAVLVADAQGALLQVNPAAEGLLGAPSRQLVGTPLRRLLPLLPETAGTTADTLLRRPDGRSTPVQTRTVALKGPGKAARLVVVRDPDSDGARREAVEFRRLLETLTSAVPGLVYRCRADDRWRFLYCSDGALPLTGYRPEELAGRSAPAFLELIHADDRERVQRIVREATAAGRPFRVEYRIKTRDGGEKWVWEQGRPVQDEGDPLEPGPDRLEGFITDVTERVRAEKELRRAEELRRRGEQLAYVGELAARLNHEIKNPLATVRAGLEVLQRELKLDDDHGQVLATVVQEIRNVNRLVSSLLSVSRPEVLQPARHDLVVLVREAVDPFRPVVRRRGIELDLRLPDGALPARVDERLLHRFLGNLLMNAIDVLGNRGRITVTARRVDPAEAERHFPAPPDEVVAVCVEDDGPGIPPDVFDQLFDPFFTTKATGTGLGLPVARDIIEFHGGTLVVRSRPGEGAAFEAFLPVAGPPAIPEPGAKGGAG